MRRTHISFDQFDQRQQITEEITLIMSLFWRNSALYAYK